MGSVRDRPSPAWVAHGRGFGPVCGGSLTTSECIRTRNAQEGPVLDLIYIGLTIVVFAALFLLIKGVERFER
jgi:hypothetical protein